MNVKNWDITTGAYKFRLEPLFRITGVLFLFDSELRTTRQGELMSCLSR